MTRSNEAIARAFARQFTPPLACVRTEHIDGKPVPDAWCVAYWDAGRNVGITAHVIKGHIKAYIEAAAPGDAAESVGQVMAKALGMFKGE
jgi:hypothetical protein